MRESPSVTLFLSWLTMVTIKTSRLEVSKNAWRLSVISWDIRVDKNVTYTTEDFDWELVRSHLPGADLGGGYRGCAPPPPPAEMTCGFLIQLVFCKKKKTMWFIGVVVEQETSAPPPKKNPGSPLPTIQRLSEVMKKILRTSWKLWKCYSDSFNIRNTEKLTWLLLYARLPLLFILGVPPEVVQTAPGRPHLKGVSAVSKKNKNLLIRALNSDCFRRGWLQPRRTSIICNLLSIPSCHTPGWRVLKTLVSTELLWERWRHSISFRAG